MSLKSPVTDIPVHYPETDGKPMAETEFQLLPLIYAIAALKLYSEVLGLEFRAYRAGGEFRLVEPKTGYVLPSYAEAETARLRAIEGQRQAEAAKREAETRAIAAEAELAQLRAELARLRGTGDPSPTSK